MLNSWQSGKGLRRRLYVVFILFKYGLYELKYAGNLLVFNLCRNFKSF